jgi:hypothetical protein
MLLLPVLLLLQSNQSAIDSAASAVEASGYATDADNSAIAAAASFDEFDDRYLGSKASAPTLDNDGNALLTGALYWNTTSNNLFVWTGSAWNPAAFDVGTALFDADIGVTVQGYDATIVVDADIGVSILPTPQVVSANYSTTSGKFLVVDTAGITITLPATPAAGDYVVIKDGTGDAATSSFTIARNGSNIAASATDLTFNKNYAEITMTYIDATIGWSV